MIPQPSSQPSKPVQGLAPKAGAADAEESEQKASAKTADRRANDESVLLSPPPPRHGTLGEGARGRGGQLRAGLGGRGRGGEGGLTHRLGHHFAMCALRAVYKPQQLGQLRIQGQPANGLRISSRPWNRPFYPLKMLKNA